MMHTRTDRRLAQRLAVLIAVVTAVAAHAQLSVALKTDRKHYLRFEPVEVTVVLRNYSGNTLIFGDEEGANRGYLHFAVQQPEGPELRPSDLAANPVDDLILGAGESRQLVLNLNHFFDLRPEGSYIITAQVGHKRLPSDYRSQPVSIDVREGTPVVTRDLGLPQADGGAPIKAVTATLLLFHDGEQWLYCLRAETEDVVLGTVRLGPQISGSQPQMDADASSDLHVLVQVQSRLCLYAVYSVSDSGLRLRQRRYYTPDQFGPRLSQAPGYLKVVGGTPTQEGVDAKAPEVERGTPVPAAPGAGVERQGVGAGDEPALPAEPPAKADNAGSKKAR